MKRLSMVRWLAALCAVVALVAASVGTAGAAPRQNGDKANQKVERQYRREQAHLRAQARNLAKADKRATQIQTFIDNQKAKGQSTADLDKALAAFRQQLATAHQQHDAAAATLKGHAGFSAEGKVTDAKAAAATLKSAHEQLQKAHDTLHQARKDLLTALKQYRKDHPKAPAAPADQNYEQE